MKRGASRDESPNRNHLVKRERRVKLISSSLSDARESDANITSHSFSRKVINLTDDMDLTEEKMRQMKPEELHRELIRRGVDWYGLRKIWMERSVVPARAVPFSSMAFPTLETENATLLASHDDKTETAASVLQLPPNKTYVLRFDGGSKGNPGISGAGMVLYEKHNFSNEIWCGSLFLTKYGTNNEAEYKALINGLKCAKLFGVKHILAEGDSELVVRQMLGSYKCKSPNLIPLLKEAMSVKRDFLSFQIKHIPRAQNSRADELANEAMSSRESRGMKVFLDSTTT
jgi:ribonuclease HI/probable phosphoglycerate mutase